MIQEYANIVDHLQVAVLDPVSIGALVSGGSALLKGIGGLFQSGKAKRQLKKLKDPGYNIPGEFQKNLSQAEQMARVGIPSQEYNLASTNIQRGTQAGLRQLGRMSNPFAGIAGLQRGQSDAFARLDAQNAAARRQNILQAMGARRELAGQKLAQQQYSQQRYMDQVNQANALRGAGIQNTFGALSDVGNIGMMMMQGESGGGSQTMGQRTGALNIPRAIGSGVTSSGQISTPKQLPGYNVPRG